MPAPQLPPRKWAPQPVETTAKSTCCPTADEKPPPRRFNVEPLETNAKSSRQRTVADASVDNPKPARRFAPQPVETTRKSTKDRSSAAAKEQPKPARRFAPQPVETSQKSSKDRSSSSQSSKTSKFLPQPIETTTRSSRETTNDEDKPPPRKFAPVLLDTATRSRRANKPSSPLPMKAESEHNLHATEHRRHITGTKTRRKVHDESDGTRRSSPPRHIDLSSELRRQIAPLDGSPGERPLSMASNRSHSYMLPDLDTIESSESDREASSRSVSPGAGSPITTSDSSFIEFYKHATRIRESVDENFAQYFLQLEAKRAQARLQEQALAAFANSDFHEPFQHYVNDDNSDEEIEDRPGTWEGHDEDIFGDADARRESTAKIPWEQLELQRHAEALQAEHNANKVTKKPTESPWWNPATAYSLKEAAVVREMQSMQDRARPPMLGDDLIFPRCPSPEPARFDVTQGSASLRDQMNYLTEQSESERSKAEADEGLWQPPADKDHVITAAGTANHSKSSSKIGLWGGFCTNDATQSPSGGLAPPTSQMGLMTPVVEYSKDPFEVSFSVFAGSDRPTTPPTPPDSIRLSEPAHIDGILVSEHELDGLMAREYPDSFITQVYNYLSLGYPSLARPFDEELSKISRVSMRDLRQDDKKARQTPRGYIRLGSDFEGGGGQGITEDSCMRWQALKLYVREWVRQEKDGMVQDDGAFGNFGTIARRGSWAI
nr:hypothetical protein CFP56_22313 [Quercus suber]